MPITWVERTRHVLPRDLPEPALPQDCDPGGRSARAPGQLPVLRHGVSRTASPSAARNGAALARRAETPSRQSRDVAERARTGSPPRGEVATPRDVPV